MAHEPDDTSFTPSMNRLLFLRHQAPQDLDPKPGTDPFSSMAVPVAKSRTPTVKLENTSETATPVPKSRTPTVRIDTGTTNAPSLPLVQALTVKPAAPIVPPPQGQALPGKLVAPQLPLAPIPTPKPVVPEVLVTKEEAKPETPVAQVPAATPLALRTGGPSLQSAHPRTGNERRSSQALKLFVVTLAIMFVCFGLFGTMIYTFYEGNILPRFPTVTSMVYVPPDAAPSPKVEALTAELSATQAALLKANDAILRLQREYDALAEKQQNSEGQLSKLVTDMKQALAGDEKGKPTDTAASLSAALQVASVVPVSSSTHQELWLLKERNRLTFYADRAITQGSAEAMASLWQSLNDPELERLRDGVMAEIIRVQNYYQHLSRLPPDYRLPVREMFRDPSIRSEADLKPSQVIPLLLNTKQPPEVRIRSAYVLGGHRTKEIAAALVQAMKSDPVLDVVKEAQRTLEGDYQMQVPPLNSRAADEWWSQHAGQMK